jgi:N6-adenosine-specific RNA methylase IME4
VLGLPSADAADQVSVNLSHPLFAPLPTVAGGFACVVADVASRFKSNSEKKPGRNAMRHYECHPMPAFTTLPVRQVVADNAYLWFWTTGPLIVIGAHIPVIEAWGFRPTAMGFMWVKLNRNGAVALDAGIGFVGLAAGFANGATVDGVYDAIERLRDELDPVVSAEREAFDELGDKAKESAAGQTREKMVQDLEEAAEALQTALSAIDEARSAP